MSINTPADMLSHYRREMIERTDPERTGRADEAKIQTALDAAYGEIDSHLGSLGGYPPSPWPATLARVERQIARAYLYTDGRPEHVQKELDASLDLLRRLNRGELTLWRDTSGNPIAADTGPDYDAPDPQFGADTLEGY